MKNNNIDFQLIIILFVKYYQFLKQLNTFLLYICTIKGSRSFLIKMKLINFKFFLLKVSEIIFTIFNTSPPVIS
ncbi:hypothetical protein CQ022_07395 [Chryseobacterium culicis]|uniref:Transmembrane protein n=1 Tax=Chryseobacterium culicis TaxID=680127 RepID=A0A2S9D027_CHRCI|nr:hypothetical protein CQ022_07395 [Chryseobacterium culicis]PRB91819.1 hypothetical protein CQ033_01065 [Chryseobacterium culicis]